MHQNDQKSLIWEKQGGQNVSKSSFNQEMKHTHTQKKKKKKKKKKEKKRKEAR